MLDKDFLQSDFPLAFAHRGGVLDFPENSLKAFQGAYDEASETGWRRGRTAEDTARSIANVINRFSNLVYATQEGSMILLELRSEDLNPDSLVIFVDDPGGTDIVAEKAGVSMDPRDVRMVEDFK